MVAAWASGNRSKAAAAASPSAIATLFALPYPDNGLQARGCSQAFSPSDCDYRDGDNLLAIYSTQIAAGWYVSSVVLET